MPNLFQSLLHSRSTSSEDYLTEAFRFVMNLMLVRDSEYALGFLNWLCRPKVEFQDASKIKINSQVILTNKSRPDIEISEGLARLVYIEIKEWANLHGDQMLRYDAVIDSTIVPQRLLILLTPHPFTDGSGIIAADRYKQVLWSEVFAQLDDYKGDEVLGFLIRHFNDYLESRNLGSRQRVGFDNEGIEQLKILVDEAYKLARRETWRKLGRKNAKPDGWYGYNIRSNSWFGFRYTMPHIIVFYNHSVHPYIDEVRDLYQNEFVSMPRHEQIAYLTKFLVDNIDQVEKRQE